MKLDWGSALMWGGLTGAFILGVQTCSNLVEFANKNDSQQSLVSDAFTFMSCTIYEAKETSVDLVCHVRMRQDWLESQRPPELPNPPAQMNPPVVEKEQSKWSISYQL